MTMPAKSEPRPANQRGAARLAAVQALYQMDLGGTTLPEVVAEFAAHRLGKEVDGEQYRAADADYFRTIVEGVVAHQRDLDPAIDAALAVGWRLVRVDATLRAILRCGAYELGHRKDVPARVIITEYVDVANAFFEDEGPGVVNGVLDSIARKFREAEFA
jgi:N utilization substance protein B